jgi:hypothetical protein
MKLKPRRREQILKHKTLTTWKEVKAWDSYNRGLQGYTPNHFKILDLGI